MEQTFECTIILKSSSGVRGQGPTIRETVTCGSSYDACRMMEAKYPGSIVTTRTIR